MNWASSTYSFWSSAVPVFDDLPLWGLPLRDRWHIVDGLRHRYPIYVSEAPGGATRTRDKARLTTIILSRFHQLHLDFDSILVFSDQAAIPRVDLARLSDVGGDMVSSLESSEDLRRKIERRVA